MAGESRESMKGYRVTNRAVIVNSQLTEPQFREIEKILEQPPERHKAWAESYVFTVFSHVLAESLLDWLRNRKIPHAVEIMYQFEEKKWPSPSSKSS
jgi:hypothetical protein